jgi:hypothetical protein
MVGVEVLGVHARLLRCPSWYSQKVEVLFGQGHDAPE